MSVRPGDVCAAACSLVLDRAVRGHTGGHFRCVQRMTCDSITESLDKKYVPQESPFCELCRM